MRNGFSNIICGTIIYCESYWENKIEEIKCFAGKLELLEQRILILITRSIVLKAKKILANSESYNDHMRQILNRDSILAVRIL